jgi:hypothetical protein
MSVENPLWGSPRIQGELLKPGFAVAQSNGEAVRASKPGVTHLPAQPRPRHCCNGLFVVSTIGFDLLYAVIILRIDRRDRVWINVTTNPSAEWVASQLTEAFPWNQSPPRPLSSQFRQRCVRFACSMMPPRPAAVLRITAVMLFPKVEMML